MAFSHIFWFISCFNCCQWVRIKKYQQTGYLHIVIISSFSMIHKDGYSDPFDWANTIVFYRLGYYPLWVCTIKSVLTLDLYSNYLLDTHWYKWCFVVTTLSFIPYLTVLDLCKFLYLDFDHFPPSIKAILIASILFYLSLHFIIFF